MITTREIVSKRFADGRPHASCSAMSVVQQVALESDRLALHELLDHRPLFVFEGQRLLLPDYLSRHQERRLLSARGDLHRLWEWTYDNVRDKFTILPDHRRTDPESALPEDGAGDGGNGLPAKGRSGIDCRLYYRALLKKVEASETWQAAETPWAEEKALSESFQAFVNTHLRWSFLEAKRHANPFVSRYDWQVGARKIALWLPVALQGSARRAWLEEHVDDPDPTRPLERERIQNIVDALLLKGCLVSLEAIEEVGWSTPASPAASTLTTREAECRIDNLAKYVAEEKAASIQLQSPAIQALGPAKLKSLVLQVFANLATEATTDKHLAEQFGLSAPTFSRFAGSRWGKGTEPAARRMPDLWRNTAHVLANVPAFAELVSDGNWRDTVQTLVTDRKPPRMRRHSS